MIGEGFVDTKSRLSDMAAEPTIRCTRNALGFSRSHNKTRLDVDINCRISDVGVPVHLEPEYRAKAREQL